MKPFKFLLILTLITTTVAVTHPYTVMAQSDQSSQPSSVLKIEPVISEIAARPGEVITRSMTLTNLSNIPLPIKAYTRQFVASDDQGNSDYPDNRDKKAVQSWFVFDTADFILQPHDKRAISVTINIPSDAEPGGHYATVFFESLIPKALLSQTSLSLASRIGALFFFVIAGDVHQQGNIISFTSNTLHQHTPVQLELHFANTGNVHIRPVSIITITNWQGHKVAEIRDNGQTILPGKVRYWNVSWPSSRAFGYYHATLSTVLYPDAKPQTVVTSFWVIPLGLIGMILSGLVVLIFMLTRGRRRLHKAYRALLGRM